MAGGALDRDEFEGYVRRHEADENAHAAERHRQSNDWYAQARIWEKEIDEMRRWQRDHDVAHASAAGEFRGMLNTIRAGFVVLGVLITAFGALAAGAILR